MELEPGPPDQRQTTMQKLHVWLTIHPNRQRRIFRILPRLEEPEMCIDLIRLVLDAQVG